MKKAENRLEAELNLRMLHVNRLLKPIDFQPQLPLPRFDVDDFGGSPAKVAEQLRRAWQIPSGPIENLTELLEQAGVVVVDVDFSGMPADGVTVKSTGMPPCVFVNNDLTGDRQRLTLAHELGHLIMHDVPTVDMESEAYSFGSAFLMPESDIRQYLRGTKIDLKRLAALKTVWKTSMQAQIYWYSQLGYLRPSQTKHLWIEINKRGFKRQEPVDIAPEQPSMLRRIFELHFDQLGYSLNELAKLFCLYPREMEAWYPWVRGDHGAIRHLRVVK